MLLRMGGGTVASVQREINALWEPEIAYNTVLTYLGALRKHGWVRADLIGRAHYYSPTASLHQVRRLELDPIIEQLYDSRGELLADLIADPLTGPGDVAAARRALERRLAQPPDPPYRRTGRITREACAAER